MKIKVSSCNENSEVQSPAHPGKALPEEVPAIVTGLERGVGLDSGRGLRASAQSSGTFATFR